MGRSEYDPRESDHKAWNAGKLVGAKRALKPQQVCTRPVATALRDVSCRAENSAYGQSYAQDVGSAGDRRDRASAALDRRREDSDRPREHGGSSAGGSDGTSAQHLPIHAGLVAPHLQGGRVGGNAAGVRAGGRRGASNFSDRGRGEVERSILGAKARCACA